MRINSLLMRIAVLALGVQLGACHGPGGSLPPLPPPTSAAYRLGPGDQVRIITLADDQMTGAFRVNDTGAIALPMLGPIQASGLTTVQLEQVLAGALAKAQLIQNPSVSVEVTAYRPIFVLGEVNRPGEFPYQPGMTVVSAVAVAGGYTYRAIEDRASVVRSVNGVTTEALATRQSIVQPGDVITIYERRF